MASLKGRVFTYSLDNLAGRGDDPSVVQTVAEMENGARFYGNMTDCEPAEVALDMPVELTFRRIYEGAGFHNYFWKCRPFRKGGSE
jgi:hydroxymethylglutaryl-CoA synthase